MTEEPKKPAAKPEEAKKPEVEIEAVSQPTPTQAENDAARLGKLDDLAKEPHGAEDEAVTRSMQAARGVGYQTKGA